MGNKRRIVIFKDPQVIDESDLTDLLNTQGYLSKTSKSGGNLVDEAAHWNADLVILDLGTDISEGVKIIKDLKHRAIPTDIIVLSSQTNATSVSRALNAGADDYIRKPFSMVEFYSRLKVRFRIRELCEDLSQANQKLSDLSQKDDLTGLYNMRSMYDRIGMEIERARRTHSHLSCVMIDMDNFKSVNDTNDHLFGSFVLKEVGRILKSDIRLIDYAARYGGDEFLLVLPETDLHGVQMFTERLRQHIQDTVFTDGQNTIRLTASMGFGVYSSDTDFDAKDLVRIADHGLFEAKKQGRNRVVCIQQFSNIGSKKSA